MVNKLTTAVLLMGVSYAVFAADQGGGKVTFSGTILDAPCSVHPDSLDQAVSLGQISSASLKKAGGQSGSTAFNIKLENCDFGSPATKNNLSITFNGPVEEKNTNLFALTSGPARGAGIGLTDDVGSPVIPGQALEAAKGMAPGSHTLRFHASLQGLSTKEGAVPVVPGNFSAVTRFTLAYN